MVTIIIPIHNSEKYLQECIESAMLQTFQDLEILCIDGGSTDRSTEIVRNLQNKDSRISFIYDKNTSYGHKINVGIDRSRGNYIAILESDDRMRPDMIERLYRVMEDCDVDVADADYSEFLNYKEKELENYVCKYVVPEQYNHLISYEEGRKPEIANNGIWTGLYRKSFLIKQNIRLNESPGASYQDMSFLFLTSFLAKKVYHINVPLYQYRVDNVGSSVRDNNKIFEIVWECEFLKNDLLKRGIKKKAEWKLYYIRKYNAFFWNYCRLTGQTKQVFLETYINELKKDVGNKVIDRQMFNTHLYDRTFLLLNDKEKFVQKASKNSGRTFLLRVCEGLEKIDGREVVLFGVGNLGIKTMEILLQNENCIKGVCDNSRERQGEVLGDMRIISVKQAVQEFVGAVYFIVSTKYKEEMSMQLLDEGIKKENIIILE